MFMRSSHRYSQGWRRAHAMQLWGFTVSCGRFIAVTYSICLEKSGHWLKHLLKVCSAGNEPEQLEAKVSPPGERRGPLGEIEDQELRTFSATLGAELIQDQKETPLKTETANGRPKCGPRPCLGWLESTLKVSESWQHFRTGDSTYSPASVFSLVQGQSWLQESALLLGTIPWTWGCWALCSPQASWTCSPLSHIRLPLPPGVCKPQK